MNPIPPNYPSYIPVHTTYINNPFYQPNQNYPLKNEPHYPPPIQPSPFIPQIELKPNLHEEYHRHSAEDQSWVNDWLKQRIFDLKKRSKNDGIKIGQAQIVLKKSLNVLKQMKMNQDFLKSNISTLNNGNWSRKLVEIEKQKAALLNLMSPFDSISSVKKLQKEIVGRTNRRKGAKKLKAERKENLKNMYNRREQLHQTIDRWLEDQKEQVERVKRAETMKKDADCVLAEVNKKKSDGRKQINLLMALLELRRVREKAAEARGERISLEDSRTFVTIVDRLKYMWDKALASYAIEEHGLKVMLDNRPEEKPTSVDQKSRNIINEWELVLFGPRFVPSPAYWVMTYAEKDMELFIAVRKSWDTFITEYDTGTPLPIGWIVPDRPSLPEWENYLQK